MSIVLYVSGHGLGHSAREVGIFSHLPEHIPLVVKSAAPEWFWRGSLDRPFSLVPDTFDVGCAQTDGLNIDCPTTLNRWHEMQARNADRWETEAQSLRELGARLVVSDVPSFPIMVAERLGLPTICIANFTWVDIYQHLADVRGIPGLAEAAAILEAEYTHTTLCLDTGFSLPMPYFPKTEYAGIVARPGTARRAELDILLPETAHGKKLALVYVGGWGLPIDYKQVARFTDWHFLSLDAPPVELPNWSVLPKNQLPHPDLVATVDLVISKPGYGIAGECVSLGTPLLYTPRPEFAEYAALHTVLSDWPGGACLDQEAFAQTQWESALDLAVGETPIPRLAANGGPTAARRIIELYEATVQ